MNRQQQQNIQRNNLGMFLCGWGKDGDVINQVGTHLLSQIDLPIPLVMDALVQMAGHVAYYKDRPEMGEVGHGLTTIKMLVEYLEDRTQPHCPECGSSSSTWHHNGHRVCDACGDIF